MDGSSSHNMAEKNSHGEKYGNGDKGFDDFPEEQVRKPH